MEIDPNKTTLNVYLNAQHNPNSGVVIHDEADGDISLLSNGCDGSLWFCWTENGSIYLEDKPDS